MTDTIWSEDIGKLWVMLLESLIEHGQHVSPRGLPCRELLGVTLVLSNPFNNVIVSEKRKLNYRFMVAEWLWIWFGHADVATIARYNSKIAQFSDDGETFRGAYGPRIERQWPVIVQKLTADPDSRQAVIQVLGWRDVLFSTRDVPCTLTLQFLLRDGPAGTKQLNTIVNMRSSDAWLGLPYDVFNFSMLANVLAVQLGVRLGWLQLNLGSSHLYERDLENARLVLAAENDVSFVASPVLRSVPPSWLDDVLRTGAGDDRMTYVGDREWLLYAAALCGLTSGRALELLYELTKEDR